MAQQSWIQNLTVQDNILFGKKMKGGVYKRILKNCELQSDLNILPAGDLTEIGERVSDKFCFTSFTHLLGLY